MSEPMIDGDLCWGCDTRRSLENGLFECAHEGGRCQEDVDLGWLRGVAVGIAKTIADHGGATRETRAAVADSLSDAVADLFFDRGVRLNARAFLRLCDVPTLREDG